MTHPVFVIDDDDAMRDALVEMLRAEGITARGFASGVDFLERLPDAESACVLTDVRMPGMSGVDLVQRLLEAKGALWPIVVITGHAEVTTAVALMKAGVVDFIEKPFDPPRLLETVRGCLTRLNDLDQTQGARAAVQVRLARLTPRERQVFDALIHGRSNKEIALDLDISPRTVEVFRAKVMTKMEADSLSALVRMGLTLG